MGQPDRGWNSGSTSIIDVIRNLWPVTVKLGWPTLILVGATIPALLLVGATVGMGIPVLFSALGVGGPGASSIAFVAAILALPLSGAVFQAALMASGRRIVVGNESGGLLTLTVDPFRRMPAVFFAVLFVLLSQSAVVCFPGAVIVLLSPIFYVAGTRPDLSFVQALSKGYGWIKTHIMTLCGAAAGSFLTAFLIYLVVGFLGFDTMEVPGGLERLSMYQIVMASLLVIWDLLYFLVISSLLYTIDAAENGLAIN